MIEDKFILNMLDPNLDYSSNYKNSPNHKKSLFGNYAFSYGLVTIKATIDDNDPVDPDESYQLELNLEKVDELMDQLKTSIKRYENSFIEKIYSEKWVNLLEVLNQEEDLKDDFKNLIVNLKLRGYII